MSCFQGHPLCTLWLAWLRRFSKLSCSSSPYFYNHGDMRGHRTSRAPCWVAVPQCAAGPVATWRRNPHGVGLWRAGKFHWQPDAMDTRQGFALCPAAATGRHELCNELTSIHKTCLRFSPATCMFGLLSQRR